MKEDLANVKNGIPSIASSKSKPFEGKSSVSKRHSKRVSKTIDDDGDDQKSDEVVTRL